MRRLETTLVSSLLIGGMLGACSGNARGPEADASMTPDAPRAIDVAGEATNDGSVSIDANGVLGALASSQARASRRNACCSAV